MYLLLCVCIEHSWKSYEVEAKLANKMKAIWLHSLALPLKPLDEPPFVCSHWALSRPGYLVWGYCVVITLRWPSSCSVVGNSLSSAARVVVAAYSTATLVVRREQLEVSINQIKVNFKLFCLFSIPFHSIWKISNRLEPVALVCSASITATTTTTSRVDASFFSPDLLMGWRTN